MEEMIKKMNEMFEANSFTDDGRVVVDVIANGNAIAVTVCGQTGIISNLDRFTDYGIMMEIMWKVDTLYCGDCASFFWNKVKGE